MTDAVRPDDGEMYGLERLEEIIIQNGRRSAQDLVDTIVADIDEFRGGAEQPDDLTLLVTKAGPGTIAEAINAGLPLVLNDRLPGQEDGNVAYVVHNEVGEWAPGPKRAAAAVAGYLTQPERIQRASRTCQRIARPDAAKRIVRNVDSVLCQQARGEASRHSNPF